MFNLHTSHATFSLEESSKSAKNATHTNRGTRTKTTTRDVYSTSVAPCSAAWHKASSKKNASTHLNNARAREKIDNLSEYALTT